MVDALHAGMVATDLLHNRYKDRPNDWERAKKIFNISAGRVETAVEVHPQPIREGTGV